MRRRSSESTAPALDHLARGVHPVMALSPITQGRPPMTQLPYGQPPLDPTPPRRSNLKLALTVAAIFVVLGAVGAVALSVFIENNRERLSGNGFDVTVMSCSVDNGGWLPSAKMTYTIKNTAATARKATIKIEYRDSDGNLLDTDTAVTRSVPAGDSIRGEEWTDLNASGPGGKCKLVGVS